MKGYEEKSSITLTLPAGAEDGAAGRRFLLRSTVFLLLLAGELGMGAELLGIGSVGTCVVFAVPALATGLLLLLGLPKKGKLRFLAAGLAILLTAVCFTVNGGAAGAAETVNRIFAHRELLSGRLVLPMAGDPAAAWRFALAFGALSGVLLSLLTLYAGGFSLLLLFPLWFFAVRGYLPADGWLLLFSFGCVALSCARSAGLRAAAQRLVLAGVLFLLAVCVCAAAGTMPETAGVKEKVESAVHTLRYEKERNLLPEGRFSGFAAAGGRDTVLTVEMEMPESLYLRGMTGAAYGADGWTAVARETQREAADRFYWLRENGFFSALQLSLLSEALGQDAPSSEIRVDSEKACRAWKYYPLSLCAADAADHAALADEENRALSPGDGQTYAFSVRPGAVPDAYGMLEQLLTRQAERDAAEYLRLEENYRCYVYENYLDVPEDCAALLGKYPELTLSPETSYAAKAQVRAVLESRANYAERAKLRTGGSELLRQLFSAEGGSCFHYATAAVLMLRYQGIPARYAEGFAITASEAAQSPDGVLHLTGKNAHAWAEYYENGVGWLPFEVTPPMIGEMAEPEWLRFTADASALTEGAEQPTESPETVVPPEPEPVPETVETDPGQWANRPEQTPASRTGLLPVWVVILAVAGALLLALGILLLRRRRILKRREGEFNSPDLSTAIGKLFAHSLRLMYAGGLAEENTPLAAQDRAVERWFGCRSGFAEMQRMNEEALFSAHPMQEAQRSEMRSFAQQTERRLNEKLSRSQRLYQRWIRCMY